MPTKIFLLGKTKFKWKANKRYIITNQRYHFETKDVNKRVTNCGTDHYSFCDDR